jgi:biopolymer transport protein ExbB
VGQALIATALGLLVALFALFGYNFFSRVQSHAMIKWSGLNRGLVDHIRLDHESDGTSEQELARLPLREKRANV